MRQDHKIPLIRAVRTLSLLPIVALLATYAVRAGFGQRSESATLAPDAKRKCKHHQRPPLQRHN